MAMRNAAPKSNKNKKAITTNQTKQAVSASIQTKQRNKPDASDSKEAITLDDVMNSVNRELGMNVVRRASDMETLYLLRRPTGITSLDIELGGGFPASATTVLVGPDGAGKDYLLWITAAEVQRIYGDDFGMCIFFTEFKADKLFMRDFCGLKIAFSPKELDELDAALVKDGKPPMTKERRAELQTQVGQILIIDGVTAEKGFDAIIKLVMSNRCQMIVVNSIGSLQTEAKEEQESFEDFARQSSEATLISKFMPKLAMILNNDRNGRNETTLFLVNQMRAKRDVMPVRGRPITEKDKYEPGARVHALKHGKAIELAIHKGPYHRDEVEKVNIGRKIRWELTKGKLGTHDGKQGEFDFYYDIGVDKIGDLINTCLKLDVFEGTTWIKYNHEKYGFNLQGRDKVRRYINEHPELVDILRAECFRRAGVVCRFR
jgi:RecA/RadA recombinase